MTAGIRATVQFPTASICSISEFAGESETRIESISTSVTVPSSEGSVTEFLVDTYSDAEFEDSEFSPVFSYGTKQLYRVNHEDGSTCPCEVIGQFGCPIDRYLAQDDELTVSFYAVDFEQLQDIVGELRDRFSEMDLMRLIRSPKGSAASDEVLVDRSSLTDRQIEVLELAYRQGYFDRPKGANASELAEELGISSSTFTEHLAAAQTKLLKDILER